MNKETILTIDDDEAIRSSFHVYLSDCGFKALTAENGIDGLAIFVTEQPDVVLVDLLMPGMDGFEVISRIKTQSPETPLIVVSGVGELGDAIKAVRLGAWDYLTKPVGDLSTLLHSIEKVLERARLIKENREYQEHLEEKVISRTKELSEANKNLTQLNERLRRIVETTRNLSTCDTVDQFTRRLLDEFAHHMQVTGGSLYLSDEKGLRLAHVLDPGHAPQFIPFPLPENSVFGNAINRKIPVLIDDISKESKITTSGWNNYRYQSTLVYPLVDENRFVIGVLSLHDKTKPLFNTQDKEIGSILVSFCCEALRAVRASEEVSESEKRLSLAINGANLGTWDWTLESGNVLFNEQWMNMTGFHVSDLEQTRTAWEKLIHPNDMPSVTKALNDHLNGLTEYYETEHRIRNKSGQLVWVLDRGKITERDKSGKPLRICGTYLDITARKQFEKNP